MKKVIIIIGIVFVSFFVVMIIKSGNSKSDISQEKANEIDYWTCSMHPQVKAEKPGLCPICAMELIPVKTNDIDDREGSDARINLSERAKNIAKISTSLVEKKFIVKKIRMNGKVDYDETRLSYITAWINGRIDRLFVDYTGINVTKGDHMVYMYSPELLSAQEEYLQTLKNESIMNDDFAKETLVNSAEKLRLLGLLDDQIKELEAKKIASEFMTIYSPVTGIVIEKNAKEGSYVNTGTKIYTIADLSHLWIKLDAYEADIKFLKYGQEVELRIESYPGEIFEGKITFISPVFDETTRTVTVRVNIENKDQRLKPGMFVTADISVQLSNKGPIINNNLKGKWICPMHHEIVKEEKGVCDICAMDLVKIEKVLDVSGGDYDKPVVIPVTAPLLTGKRAVVYVEKKNKDNFVYEGREVVLGEKTDDYYIVKAGIKEGERVVTKGNFKIDSALAIQAKKSMMSYAPSGNMQISDNVYNIITELYNLYFELQSALAGDDFKKSIEKLNMLKIAILAIKDNNYIADFYNKTNEIFMHLEQLNNIDMIRNMIFYDLSYQMIDLEKKIGHKDNKIYYEMFCPMANNGKGAFWLQDNETLANPYYGSKMFSCGTIKDKYLSK